MNVTKTREYIGEYDIDGIFNIKLQPFGIFSVDLTPVEPNEIVDIRVHSIDSPNEYSAYFLQIDNFKLISLDQNYTLNKLLPKDGKLAMTYNVTWTPSGFEFGVLKLNDSFNIQLKFYGRATFRVIPISDEESEYQSVSYWRDTNPGVRVLVQYMPSPTRQSAYRVIFTNFLYHQITKLYTLFEVLPHTKTLAKTYDVSLTDNHAPVATLITCYDTLEVRLDPAKTISFDVIPAPLRYNYTQCGNFNFTDDPDDLHIELYELI